jgi:hypothetical protein
MGTRCEHMAVFYMSLETPWNPLVPVAVAYSCFNYQHRRSTDTQFSMLEFMLCDESLRRPGEEYNTWRICVGVLGRCLLSLRRTTSKRTWRNVTRQASGPSLTAGLEWKIHPNVTCQKLAIEFLRTNRGRIPIYRVGPGYQFKIACVSESQAHDRAPSTNCLYVIDLTINLLFIAAGIAPVVWRRFLLQDRAIKHGFVGGEKPRDREVDDRCQRELYRVRYPAGLT